MKLSLEKDWQKIKVHFKKSFGVNMHVSIASVNVHNEPTVTPIGSLFLNKNQTGFYFEKFATKLGENAKENKSVCILAVNSNKWLWLKSLFKGFQSVLIGAEFYESCKDSGIPLGYTLDTLIIS